VSKQQIAKSGASRKIVKPEAEVDTQRYQAFVNDLKSKIREARHRTALSVNRELVLLYWNIGREILGRQDREGWGAKIIDRLAKDLLGAFPEMKGLSARNLKYMRAFAEAWTDLDLVQQVASQLPWGHNMLILDSCGAPEERTWYARQTIEHGWSRNVLSHQIDSGLFSRQGKAATNFARTLPSSQSELAQQLIKDPYDFEFLPQSTKLLERDLHRGLVDNLCALILELGKGFAFVGSQYPLEVGNNDYYLDLLFYHLRLRAFIVLEIKVEEFKPEFAGKMSFYLSAVDDTLRHATDAPSIGIILCKGRDHVTVEYALRDTTKPMGVVEYRLARTLPTPFKNDLPTAEELSAGLSLMSLVQLRVQIERALHDFATRHGAGPTSQPGAGLTLQELKRQGLVPPNTDQVLDALRVLNEAIGGGRVAPEALEHAVTLGNEFLKDLEQ
jgi:predicted nuclease of restriction endonuclease-like (RecB) superfamily